jgi:hypothetical protein
MFPRPAARRTAAALTAALVAILLVTFGGPTRASAHRATIGASHAGSAAKAARVQHAVPPVQNHQTPQHLDLATTLPSAAPDVRATVAVAAPDAAVVRTGTDVVTPTGRAPPAL